MPGKVSWQLNAAEASLVCGELCCSLDAHSPQYGLRDVTLRERQVASSYFLGIEIDAAGSDVLADLYPRGGDLIARYAQTPGRPFGVLVYWRAGLMSIDSDEHPYVDLLVSVETNLLELRPRLEARTRLAPSTEVILRHELGYCIARYLGTAISYIELRHPNDALTTSTNMIGDGVQVTTRLFGQPLEKGVILRSRLRGLFVPSGDDEMLAQAALAEFAASPPPLTS